MKKVLGLLAITGFVACSNGESTAPAVDTNSQTYKDSVTKANTPAPTATPDSATMKKDSMPTAVKDSGAAKTTEAAKPADAAHH